MRGPSIYSPLRQKKPIMAGEVPPLPRRKGGGLERLMNPFEYIGLPLGLLEWEIHNLPRKPTKKLVRIPAQRADFPIICVRRSFNLLQCRPLEPCPVCPPPYSWTYGAPSTHISQWLRGGWVTTKNMANTSQYAPKVPPLFFDKLTGP
jgi:hypothetical protein